MMKTLMHHGRAMRWEPVNIATDKLIAALRAGRQVHVRLEPGDATRYDLLVTWLPGIAHAFYVDEHDAPDALLVLRVISGEIAGSAVYAWFTDEGVAHLANGNEWTAELLDWWLHELTDCLIGRAKAVTR